MKHFLTLLASAFALHSIAQLPQLSQVTLPFYENFEDASGSFVGSTNCVHCDSVVHWGFHTNNQTVGRVRFDLGLSYTAVGVNDSVGATLDCSSYNDARNYLTGTLNMSNYDTSTVNAITLIFSYYTHNSTPDPAHKVWIRGDSTSPFIEIYDLNANGIYQQWKSILPIDLAQILRKHNQNFSNSFQIRFGQAGDSPADINHGSTFDDITIDEVHCFPVEDIAFSKIAAQTITFNAGHTAALFDYEYGPCGFTLGTGIRDTANMRHATITGLSSSTCYDIYLRRTCDTTASSTWAGPFSVTTMCTGFSPVTLPFFENFENASGSFIGDTLSAYCHSPSVQWSFETSNQAYGRLWFNNSFSNTSIGLHDSVSATMDGTGGITQYGVNYLIGTFDLSNYDTVSNGFLGLNFFHLEHGNMSYINELVWVRGGPGDDWIEVYDLNETGIRGQWVESGYIDVTKALREANQKIGSNFQVRFCHSGSRPSISMGAKDGRSIDDLSIVYEPCLQLERPVFKALKPDQVTLEFSDSLATFEIEFGPCGFVQGTGVVLTDSLTSTTLHSLVGSTCYEVYVRRVCSNTSSSSWGGPYSFETSCGYTAPYFQNFENFVVPNMDSCFSIIKPSQYTDLESVDNQAYSGSKSIYFNSKFMMGSDLYLVSPAFLDLDSNKQVSFYLNASAYSGIEVGTLSDPADPTTYTHYKTIPPANLQGSTWTYHVVEFNNYIGSDQYVAIRHNIPSTYTAFFLDDFHYEEIPACKTPTFLSLHVDSIMGSSAKLTWGSGGTGSKTYIIWGGKGFNPAVNSIGKDSVSGATSSYTMTGLSGGTAYDVYIRENCGIDGLSKFLGPYTFYSGCDPSPAILPIFDGFENNSGVVTQDSIFSCEANYYWSFSKSGNQGSVRFDFDTTGSFKHYNGYRSAKFSANSQFDSVFVTLSADLSNYTNSNSSVELSYFFANHANPVHASNKVWARGSINDAWVEMYNWQSRATGWNWSKDSVYLDTLLASHNQNLSASTQIRWVQKGSSFTPERGFGLDDVMLKEVKCIKPANFVAQPLSDTSTALIWEEIKPGGSYEVWIGSNGFYQGPQTTGGVKLSTSNDTLWIDTLQPNSCYEVLVRRICGAGDTSEWVGPLDFCTPCGDLIAPYFEDFDGLPAGLSGNLGNCWIAAASRPNINNPYIFKTNKGYTPTLNTGPSGDAGTGLGTYVYIESLGSFSSDMATLTTISDVDISAIPNPELRFAYHMYGAATSLLKVEIDTGNGWTTIHTITGQQQTSSTAPWANTIVPLSGYGSRFKIRFQSQKGAMGAGDIAVDNIEIDKPITCLKPSAISLSGLSATGVSLTVTPGGVITPTMQISYGPSLSQPANGIKSVFMGGNYSITNLSASTQYCIYVRSICAVGDTSHWFGPYCFSTQCSFKNAPYYESFDGNPGPGLPSCWHKTTSGNMTVAVVDSTDRGTPIPSAPNCLEINDGTFPVVAVSPPFADLKNGLNQIRVKVAYEIASLNFSDTLFIGTMANPSDVNTFRKLDYFDVSANNGAFAEYIIKLTDTSLIGTNNHIAFLYDSTPTSNFEYYIDDFHYENIPCGRPSDLKILSDTCKSVTLSWNANYTGSIIEYGLKGFTPGSGTYSGIVSSPYTITGFASNSDYDVYVADTCGNDTSIYIGPVTFRTDNLNKPGANINLITDSTANGAKYFVLNASGSNGATGYTWNLDNGTFATGIQVIASYSSNGAKTIVLQTSNLCGVSHDSLTVNVNIGMAEMSLWESFRFYPNPAREEVTIQMNLTEGPEVEILVWDLAGKEVLKTKIWQNQSKLDFQLDIQNLASGIYTVKVSNGHLSAIKKLVKE